MGTCCSDVNVSFSTKILSPRLLSLVAQAPKVVKVFINLPRSMGFDDAERSEATQVLELSEEDYKEDGLIPLRYVKFQNVQSVTVRIRLLTLLLWLSLRWVTLQPAKCTEMHWQTQTPRSQCMYEGNVHPLCVRDNMFIAFAFIVCCLLRYYFPASFLPLFNTIVLEPKGGIRLHRSFLVLS